MQLPDSDIKTREVLAWKGVHLLHYDLSSCSQKVRILLGELGVEYISHPVNLMRDEHLKDQRYLLGERMTLADFSWFITLHRLNLAGYPFRDHPNLREYFARIAGRPAFRKEVAAGPLMLRLAGSVYRRLNRFFRKSLRRDYGLWRNEQPAA